MQRALTQLMRLARDRNATTAIEYGVIAALVGIGIVVSLNLLKGKIAANFLIIQVSLAFFTNR